MSTDTPSHIGTQWLWTKSPADWLTRTASRLSTRWVWAKGCIYFRGIYGPCFAPATHTSTSQDTRPQGLQVAAHGKRAGWDKVRSELPELLIIIINWILARLFNSLATHMASEEGGPPSTICQTSRRLAPRYAQVTGTSIDSMCAPALGSRTSATTTPKSGTGADRSWKCSPTTNTSRTCTAWGGSFGATDATCGRLSRSLKPLQWLPNPHNPTTRTACSPHSHHGVWWHTSYSCWHPAA